MPQVLILFPGTLASWFGQGDGPVADFLQGVSGAMSPGQPLYVMMLAAAIIFFCFFYTALVFNPRETADNLKKSGAFIPGIRPGEQTSKYIDKVMTRLTLAGAGVYYLCLFGSTVYDHGMGRSVLFRRYIFIDYRSSDYGLYGTSTNAYDVSSI